MLRLLVQMLLAGALLLACGAASFNPAWPATANDVQRAPPAIAALRLLVTINKERLYGQGSLKSDDDPRSDEGQVRFAEAMKDVLKRAGLSVVRDELEAYDYEFELRYTQRTIDYEAFVVNGARVKLAGEAAGQWTVVSKSGWERRWTESGRDQAEQGRYERLKQEFDKRCGIHDDWEENPTPGGGQWSISRAAKASKGDIHRLAANTLVNAMTSCPEFAKIAKFVGSRGMLASGVRFADPLAGVPPASTVPAPPTALNPPHPPTNDFLAATPQPASYALIVCVERPAPPRRPARCSRRAE